MVGSTTLALQGARERVAYGMEAKTTHTEKAAGWLARKVNRRDAIDTGLKALLAVGFGIAGVGSAAPALALAVCGPSPNCPSLTCNNSTKKCNSRAGKCKNTNYGHGVCGTSYSGCWYIAPWLCCDCCCTDATGASCSSCGSGWKKCSCQFTCC